MTLQQLKYFIETSNSGSISKAAERLYLSQPTLSSALRDLEAEIGHILFSRTSKGTHLTHDGEEFLRYARQVVEQVALLEERCVSKKTVKSRLFVISQHYAFAVKAFMNMIFKHSVPEYDYNMKEGKTFEVIDDIRCLRSEIGVLYIDRYNRTVVEKLLREGELEFHLLFIAQPYVLLSREHPLAGRDSLIPEDLTEYPRVSFEQSDYNVLYFSEEMEVLKTGGLVKSISVSDRGIMYHLLLGLNAYTLTTGLQGLDLYGGEVTAVPFRVEGPIPTMEVGYISRKGVPLSEQAQWYIEELEAVAAEEACHHSEARSHNHLW